ncbi:DoxX family protein [Lysobacter niabensis]|uniref:DoxX family protein n=1 Tax=Agrilutibacter niabensis TaxID=380628 RepID=UPI003618B02F
MNDNTRADLGKLVLRLALGLLVLLHGIAKLKGGLAGIVGMVEAAGLPGFIGYGVLVGEVLAPLLVLIGAYARVGGVLIALNMLVAIALAHVGQLTQLNEQGGWALELQGMFLAGAIAVALLGPGSYGVNTK